MNAASNMGAIDPRKEAANVRLDHEAVAFLSCGVTLRGIIVRPKGSRPLPAIVMAPGMSGVKEGSIMKFAENFASIGFAVLAFDNANFGESEGVPRQEADPMIQRIGYRDAITYLSLRKDIDCDRIGIFGTSYSGGHVLNVAAHDRRVKCVVSQIPAISGFEAFIRGVRADQRDVFLEMLNQDRRKRFSGEAPAMIKSVSDVATDLCIMPGKPAYEYFMKQATIAPNWRNEVTLRSIDLWIGTDNAVFAQWISPTPLLMIVALQDELAPPDLALDAFSRAREPKKLVTIPGNHFSPYSEHFLHVSKEAREWFSRHLLTEETSVAGVQ